MEDNKEKNSELKLLVTGPAGFIGSHLIDYLLLNSGHVSIRCLEKNVNYKNESLEIIYGDILDKKLIEISLKGIEIVIHLAALKNAGNDSEMFETNITGTKILIDACMRNKTKKIIFISSLNATLNVMNAYSRSKFECEKYLKASGLNYVIIRPSIVYGPNDKGSIAKYINIIRKYPVVPVLGGGENLLQPIYVKDLAGLIMKSLNDRYKNLEIFAVGSEIFTYNQMIDQISDNLKVKRMKIHFPISIFYILVNLLSIIIPGLRGLKDKLILYKADKIYKGKMLLEMEFITFSNGLKETI